MLGRCRGDIERHLAHRLVGAHRELQRPISPLYLPHISPYLAHRLVGLHRELQRHQPRQPEPVSPQVDALQPAVALECLRDGDAALLAECRVGEA